MVCNRLTKQLGCFQLAKVDGGSAQCCKFTAHVWSDLMPENSPRTEGELVSDKWYAKIMLWTVTRSFNRASFMSLDQSTLLASPFVLVHACLSSFPPRMTVEKWRILGAPRWLCKVIALATLRLGMSRKSPLVTEYSKEVHLVMAYSLALVN